MRTMRIMRFGIPATPLLKPTSRMLTITANSKRKGAAYRGGFLYCPGQLMTIDGNISLARLRRRSLFCRRRRSVCTGRRGILPAD